MATCLGSTLGIHTTILTMLLVLDLNLNESIKFLLIQWCTYICFIMTFHLSEFFVTACYNSSVVSADSFMVNHSKAYTIAMIISWVEFWIEFSAVYTFEIQVNMIFHIHVVIRWLGLLMLLFGQIMRTVSMATCGESFNHLIQNRKKDNHVLITRGVYAYFRHPSYVGWFYWSIGTQIVLMNPISVVAYALASWDFFRKRIPYEEITLTKHFGSQYTVYVEGSWIGIPFIPRRYKDN